jgi:hypothetical protein
MRCYAVQGWSWPVEQGTVVAMEQPQAAVVMAAQPAPVAPQAEVMLMASQAQVMAPQAQVMAPQARLLSPACRASPDVIT